MFKNKTPKNKLLIRHHLCKLLDDKTYEEITIKDICEKANISRMSFYRYYSNKDDVFKEYTDERFEEFYHQIRQIKPTTAKEFIVNLFLFIKKYQAQINILKKAHRQYILMEQFDSYAKYLLSKFYKGNTYFRTLNIITVSFISGGIFDVLMLWAEDDMKQPAEEIASILVDMLSESIIIKQ